MERETTTVLRIGDWCVDPTSGQISRDGESARLETRAMRLLVYLAERAGEVVSIDELLDQVWAGVTVSSDSVYQAVTSLRRLLGDDPKQPTYIATVPRLGYRMVAKVSPWVDELGEESSPAAAAGSLESSAPVAVEASRAGVFSRTSVLVALGVSFFLALMLTFLLHGRTANVDQVVSQAAVAPPQKSIAVLPFLDLTEGMHEGEFADGMTEELIDKLSKIPDLRVPPPTSSFFYQGKQIPVADIAKALSVAYVLDGSVRKSGDRVRVAARLVRAENGYVVWSETYDRPLHDILMVQDDIAGEVTKALRASIDGASNEAK